jgi:hypothetical protein
MMPEPHHVYLHQLRTKIQRQAPERLGSFTTSSMQLEAVRKDAWGMLMELSASLLGAQVLSENQEFYIEYPASWWQHLKDEHAPAWFTRRWPVKMTRRVGVVNFTRYDTYPLADMPLPPDEFGYPVRVEIFRRVGEVPDLHEGPPGPPRWVYASRVELSSSLFDEAFPRLMAATRTNSDGPHPRVAIEIILDTLERFGINTSQLADQSALLSPRPEREPYADRR